MKWTDLDPAEVDLSAASIVKFLKLAEEHELTVRVQATRGHVEATYYASKTKTHNVGDLKKEGHEVECVFITITNMLDFAALASWYDGVFQNCLIGGKASGHWPEQLFNQSTKTMEEIKRCLS